MTGDLGGAAGEERSQEREVAGGEDADSGVPRAAVDLLEVLRRQAARADDDCSARGDGREDVLLDRRGVREVDDDVGAGVRQCLGDRSEDGPPRSSKAVPAAERETPEASSRSSAPAIARAIGAPVQPVMPETQTRIIRESLAP